MKRFVLILSLAVAPVVAAQAPADSGRASHRRDHGGFDQQRGARLREALGLTDEQAAKLRTTAGKFRDQRRSIIERSRTVSTALRAQLRPGVAANSDSVRKLLDLSDQNGAALAQLRRDERKEMATYLSPVQLARLQLMRQRMMGRFARFRHGRGGWRSRGGRGSGDQGGWEKRWGSWQGGGDGRPGVEGA